MVTLVVFEFDTIAGKPADDMDRGLGADRYRRFPALDCGAGARPRKVPRACDEADCRELEVNACPRPMLLRKFIAWTLRIGGSAHSAVMRDRVTIKPTLPRSVFPRAWHRNPNSSCANQESDRELCLAVASRCLHLE